MDKQLIALSTALCIGLTAAAAVAELKVLDKPLWILPGQQFRVCIEQPEGSGKLAVTVPETLDMFDTWDQDAIQRFYFRSLKPGDATVHFSGAGGQMTMQLEVIAWADVYTPREYASVQLPRIWPLGNPDYDELKTRRTLYTESDLAALGAGGAVTERAKRWVETADEDIYNIIPGPSVPRTCLIVLGSQEGGGVGKGCPVCGTDIYKGRDGFYPWQFSPGDKPWKVICPNCKTEFPSNDWHEGDMHSGEFPDDGYGCEPLVPVKDRNGRAWRWPFIAYYHQWAAYMNEFTPGIYECALAYAGTGDKRYAHKCAVGLFRFAEAMVDMSLNLNHRKLVNRDGIYRWPVGAPTESRFGNLSSSFSYIQPNWDTPRMENCARAWDIIFDQLDDDAELLEFCRSQHHPEIRTIDDFKRFIEAGVIRTPVQMCLDNAVSRNYPQQETTAATLALALATPGTIDIADHLLNKSGVRFAVTNQSYKDGAGHESPSYNGIQIRDMPRLFQTLEQLKEQLPDLYVPPRFVSPMRDPKFRRQYDFPLEFSLIGRTYANIGDAGSAGTPNPIAPSQGFPCKLESFIEAWKLTGDPIFAQAMYGPDGSLAASIDDPELRAAAEKYGTERGWQVIYPSNILDGYGHAILRSGDGPDQRALWLRYARVPQHAHPDMLTYGYDTHKRHMLPDLGYPVGWTYATHWETNWGTHYGTKIVGVRAWDFDKGELTTFVGKPPVQLATAESTAGSNYRQRCVALIDLSPSDSYAIAIERVEGGQQQIFSFHGPDGPTTLDGISPVPYEGTALGDGVEYDDLSAATEDPELTSLVLMRDPARATADGVWSIDYELRNQAEDIHLKMTSIYPDGGEVVTAQGQAPGGRSSYDITWVLQKTTGEAPLSRQYVNLLEPYIGTPLVQSVERLEVAGADPDARFAPLAFRVQMGERTDTIIIQHTAGAELTVDGIVFDGEFGVYRERAGQFEMAHVTRGTTILKNGVGVELSQAQYTGQVVACDYPNSAVTIAPAPPEVSALVGRHVRISNGYGSSASYHIRSAEIVEGGCRLGFDIDPRIGEGFVAECADELMKSATSLRMAGFRYYDGKKLSNEDNSRLYTISSVSGSVNCGIHADEGVDVSAAALRAAFSDADGDGLVRFLIYDYGPGDTVSIESFATVARQGYLLTAGVGGGAQATVAIEKQE